ncbi:hypothetical protein CC78DRAFT_537046 [Lojkania enalia]|uniref:Uncharacterized protein n=1 Tax=Lojkania enalia TaxID=147567 RepID=A0A9P4MYQ4_9PLEO|nr:hypothetical protein CC78DRAFT_537046 [Didymosphaeria enalia]
MSLLRGFPTRRLFSRPATLSLARPLSSTPRSLLPRKDTQDKDSLNPTSTEYSKSGSDDAAAHDDAAFNPNKTSPETEKETTTSTAGNDPLNVSPGNPEVSKPRSSTEGGASEDPSQKSSGGGSAPKAGGGKSG